MSTAPTKNTLNERDLPKPEAIFFDWDGTLVDSYTFLEKAHNAVKASFGLPPLKPREFDIYFGMPREKLFAEVYGSHSEEAKRAFERYYLDNHLSDLTVITGVANMLETLAKLDICLGVVSNKKGNFLRAEIDYLGWGRYFGQRIVGAGEAAKDKPDPAPLLLALEKASLNPRDMSHPAKIWYVGDTLIDVQCAVAAGCTPILVEGISDKAAQNAYVKNYAQIQGFLLQS
ncbi:MAG: HAD family hydrolase [Alphaproteobacteria bacterium]